jgi:cytochrome c-type biogenesis protein CcmF
MVLWVLILALFGAAVAMFGRNLPATLKANVLAVQASIAVAFCLFIVTTSNPFARLDPPPFDGRGLNPILQDPALAFHPPFLYTGYVGFSMAFSFAIAALIEGRTDAAWARWVRPWTLAAWMCLTIGIAMGSWWAYYELGWGGFWFWDPVENASFMPWLAGTALLHSALVMEKRDALKVWTVLLAILTFSLSLMGTFLVRSGVLTSVHAFAVDPMRGVFVLAIMALFTGGGLALFAHRARDLNQGGLFAPISREGGLVLNNILLTTACATVLIGTLYPLALEALTGAKISVGAPYFNMTFAPLMVPLLLAMPFGPLLAWKRGDVLAAGQRLIAAALTAIIMLAATFAVVERGPWLAPFGIAIGVWVMAGAVSEIVFRVKAGHASAGEIWRRLGKLPRSAYGTLFAHFGVGLLVVGIVATSAYRSERILVMKPGDRAELAGYEIVFRGAVPSKGPNYTQQVGLIEVLRDGAPVTELEPAKRLYDAPPQPTSEAGIHASWRGDLYAVLGDAQKDGGFAVRLYFNPLVRFIWIGALIMFLGGAVSLSDRRLRIGAPVRARRRVAAAPAE